MPVTGEGCARGLYVEMKMMTGREGDTTAVTYDSHLNHSHV